MKKEDKIHLATWSGEQKITNFSRAFSSWSQAAFSASEAARGSVDGTFLCHNFHALNSCLRIFLCESNFWDRFFAE